MLTTTATGKATQAGKALTWTVRIVCNGMYEWPQPQSITITRSTPLYTQLQRAFETWQVPLTLDPKTVHVACSKQAKVIVVAVAVTPPGNVCPTQRPVSHALLNLPDLKFTRIVSGRQTWRVRILCKGTAATATSPSAASSLSPSFSSSLSSSPSSSSSHEIAALLHLDVEMRNQGDSGIDNTTSNDARLLGLMRFLRTSFTNTTPLQFMKDYRVRVAWNSSEQVAWLYLANCERSEQMRQLPTMPIRETSSSRSAIAQIISGAAAVGLLGLVIWRHGGDLMKQVEILHPLRKLFQSIQKILRDQVAQNEVRIKTAQSELQDNVAKVNAEADQVEKTSVELLELKEKNAANAFKMGELQETNKELAKHNEELELIGTELKTNMETLQNKLATATEDQKNRQKQLEEEKKEREKQNELHKVTVKQLESLQQKSEVHVQELKRLHEEKRKLETEFKEQQKNIQTIAEQKAVLAETLATKEAEVHKLKEEYQAKTKELSERQTQTLRDQESIERQQEEIQGLMQAAQEQERNTEGLREQLVQIHEQQNQQASEIRMQNEQLQKSASTLKQKEQAIAGFVKDLEAIRQAQASQKAELVRLQTDKNAIEQSLTRAESQNESIQTQLREQQATVKTQTKELAKRQTRMDDLSKEVLAVTQREAKLKKELSKASSENAATLEQLEMAHQKIQQELQNTTLQLENLQKAMNEKEQSLKQKEELLRTHAEELTKANQNTQTQGIALEQLKTRSDQMERDLRAVQKKHAATCQSVIKQAWQEIDLRTPKNTPEFNRATPKSDEIGLMTIVHDLSVSIAALPTLEKILTESECKNERAIYDAKKEKIGREWVNWTNGTTSAIMQRATEGMDNDARTSEKNRSVVERDFNEAKSRPEKIRKAEENEPERVRQMGQLKREIVTILGFPADITMPKPQLLSTAHEGKLITQIFNVKATKWGDWVTAFQTRFDRALTAAKAIDNVQKQARYLNETLPVLEHSLLLSVLQPQEQSLQSITTALASKLHDLRSAATIEGWTNRIKTADAIIKVCQTATIGGEILQRITALREGLRDIARGTIERELKLRNVYRYVFAGEEYALKLLNALPSSSISTAQTTQRVQDFQLAADHWKKLQEDIGITPIVNMSSFEFKTPTFAKPTKFDTEAGLAEYFQGQRDNVRYETVTNEHKNNTNLAFLSMSRTGFRELRDRQTTKKEERYASEFDTSTKVYDEQLKSIVASLDKDCTHAESKMLSSLIEIATALGAFRAPISADVQEQLGRFERITNWSLADCTKKMDQLSTVNTVLLRNAYEDVILGKVRICARLNFVQPPLMTEKAKRITTLHYYGDQIVYNNEKYGPFFTVFGDQEATGNATLLNPVRGKGLHSFFDQVLSGYRQVLFGYGASGSGKTYTLFGTSGTGSNTQNGAEAKGIVQAGLNYLGKTCDVEIHSIFDIEGWIHFPNGQIEENIVVWYAMEDKQKKEKAETEGTDTSTIYDQLLQLHTTPTPSPSVVSTSTVYKQLLQLYEGHIQRLPSGLPLPAPPIRDLRTEITTNFMNKKQSPQKQSQSPSSPADTLFVQDFNILLDVLTEQRLAHDLLRCTPTNRTSSRSQLLISFKVTNPETKLTGFLTVVDMAGAEDPFTIIQSFFRVEAYKSKMVVEAKNEARQKHENIENIEKIDIETRVVENEILLQEMAATFGGRVGGGLDELYFRPGLICADDLKSVDKRFCLKNDDGVPVMITLNQEGGRQVCQGHVWKRHTVPAELTCQAFYINESFHHLKKLLLAALDKKWTPPTPMTVGKKFTYDPQHMFSPERSDNFLTLALKHIHELENPKSITDQVKTTDFSKTKFVMLILVRTSPDNEKREVFVRDTLDFAQFLLASGAAEKHGVSGSAPSEPSLSKPPQAVESRGFLASVGSTLSRWTSAAFGSYSNK